MSALLPFLLHHFNDIHSHTRQLPNTRRWHVLGILDVAMRYQARFRPAAQDLGGSSRGIRGLSSRSCSSCPRPLYHGGQQVPHRRGANRCPLPREPLLWWVATVESCDNAIVTNATSFSRALPRVLRDVHVHHAYKQPIPPGPAQHVPRCDLAPLRFCDS